MSQLRHSTPAYEVAHPVLYCTCTALYSPADEVAHPVRLLEELPVLEPARAHDHLVQVLALGQS